MLLYSTGSLYCSSVSMSGLLLLLFLPDILLLFTFFLRNISAKFMVLYTVSTISLTWIVFKWQGVYNCPNPIFIVLFWGHVSRVPLY